MVNVMSSGSKEQDPTKPVKRATELSEEMVKALEDGGKAAVEAVRAFLVSVEEAFPQLESARKVEKRVTESALEMVQQLITAQSELIVRMIDNAGKTLRGSDQAKSSEGTKSSD